MEINDPHSFAVPKNAVVKHLSWDANIDFEQKKIDASATYKIESSGKSEEIVLDTKKLEIKEVEVDGKSVGFVLGDQVEHLGRPLNIPIEPDSKEIKIVYSTTGESEALQWLNPVQTADKNEPFLFTQSQAILARSWIPTQDSPGIRFTYDAKVQVPENLLALMSADNPKGKNYNGVYEFEMKQPVPAYLMALAVGDLVYEPISERTGVYAEKSVIEKATNEFADLDKMLLAAEKLYGPYQWEQYDLIVLPPSFPFGGMENPRLTFATPTILAGDRSLTSLVAHELAHSWSGNLVTNATWNDFWLNEGFTVYFEQRIMEEIYGRDYSEMLASLSYNGLLEEIDQIKSDGLENDTKLKLDLKDRNPDDGMTAIAYDKGYLFLRHLEETVGRENFDAFLKEYFSSNAFKVMTTESFVEYLDEHLFKKNDIDPDENLYAQWIYSSGLPEVRPEPSSNKFLAVEKTIEEWRNGAKLGSLATNAWSSHEWLHFVRNLPEGLAIEEMKELDEAFQFTESGNSEVLSAWLIQSIKVEYLEAYPRLEEFLINTGRRKFLAPIYSELAKTDEGTEMAKEIYAKARQNYHFVSANTIDEILNWNEAKS